MKGYPCPHCGEVYGSPEGLAGHVDGCGGKEAPIVETVAPDEPSIAETDAKPTVAALNKLKRDELDELAPKYGVDPDLYAKKSELIAAIDAA